jgi:DNA polymerase III subunit delta
MSGVVRLFWGEDDFGIAQKVQELEDGYGSPDERVFNVSRLDGRTISLEVIRGTLFSLPLFASRRLVVVSQASGHFNNPPARKQFLEMLARMPGSTELVLVEPQKLASDHWLVAWFRENGQPDSIMYFGMKKGPDMEKYIQDQVKQAGGKITLQAAAMLSDLVADDSRQAYQEVIKLLTYVNNARRIDVEDVEAICVSIAQGNVFAMVDALGNRDGRTASALLARLLEERDALSLFQLIVRQFRMILVARELMDSGGRITDLANQFHIQEFVAKKVWSQARQFSMLTIENIYHQLAEVDDRIKIGETSENLAMETFVAGLTGSKVKESH